MNEMPKRIYLDSELDFYMENHECLKSTAYIREDLVDELVAALKYCLEFNGHAFMYDDSKALAAIKKLEESDGHR